MWRLVLQYYTSDCVQYTVCTALTQNLESNGKSWSCSFHLLSLYYLKNKENTAFEQRKYLKVKLTRGWAVGILWISNSYIICVRACKTDQTNVNLCFFFLALLHIQYEPHVSGSNFSYISWLLPRLTLFMYYEYALTRYVYFENVWIQVLSQHIPSFQEFYCWQKKNTNFSETRLSET